MSLDVYLENDVCKMCHAGGTVFDANITHNLGKMAKHAGIYECLWRPDEHDFYSANDIIPRLTEGLRLLKKYPEFFQEFDAPNDWGLYIHFVPWVEAYLNACIKYPNSKVHVSR